MSSHYLSDGNYVYFTQNRLKDADAATFRVEVSSFTYAAYGIDKNSVYHKGLKLEGADAKTFRITRTKTGSIK